MKKYRFSLLVLLAPLFSLACSSSDSSEPAVSAGAGGEAGSSGSSGGAGKSAAGSAGTAGGATGGAGNAGNAGQATAGGAGGSSGAGQAGAGAKGGSAGAAGGVGGAGQAGAGGAGVGGAGMGGAGAGGESGGAGGAGATGGSAGAAGGVDTSASDCAGAIYHVSPTGSDDTGDGSQAKPWASLAKATATLTTPGATIHLAAGTYVETAESELAAGVCVEGEGPSTIIKSTSTADWTPIIHARSPEGTDGHQHISNLTLDGQSLSTFWAIEVAGRSHVSIHDITVVDFKDRGVIITGRDDNQNGGAALLGQGHKAAFCG
jgi:hypothetical protein